MARKSKMRTVDLTNPATWPAFKVTVVRHKTIREYANVTVVAPDEDLAASLGISVVRERQRKKAVKWTGAKCVESDIRCYSKVEKLGKDNNGN